MEPTIPQPNAPAQTTQSVAPPPQPNQSNKLVLILSGIIILLIGLGLGYFLTMRSSDTPSDAMKTPPAPVTTSKAPIVVTPSPTQPLEANWLTYTGTKLDSVSLSPYLIKYPATWTPLDTKTEYSDSYTLTSGEYQIKIFQAPSGGGGCLFEGSMPEGEFQPQDLRSVKFVEIRTNSGLMFRRFLSPSAKTSGTLMDFCALTTGNDWGMPTQFGAITYKIPVPAAEVKLLEMDSIVKTLQAI